MVVMGEMLGEFVASEIIVGDDSGHYAGRLEHDEVAVCARLRESSVGLEHLRDGHGLAACEERLDECSPALGESLITLPEQVGDLLVEFGVDGRQGFGLHDASVLMMVVGVVEDQAIADFDEAATEGVKKMIFGEDMVRWTDGDGVTIDQQHLITDPGVVEIVGGNNHRVAVHDLVVNDIKDEAARGDIEPSNGLVEQQEVALLSKTLSDKDSLSLTTGQIVELFPGEI